MIKQPLAMKLAITMSFLVAGIIFLCWLLNQTMLSRYLINEKKEALTEVYRTLDDASSSDELEDSSTAVKIDKLCETGNVSLLVMDQTSKPLMVIGNANMLEGHYFDIVDRNPSTDSRILEENSNYVVRESENINTKEKYILLLGQLCDGRIVFSRSSLSGINEVVKLNMRFFYNVVIITLILSFIVILITSKRVSRPLGKLSKISSDMAQFNFEAKYEARTMDSKELSELGQNMNELSDRLEKTLGDLMSANKKLQQDIQQKEEVDEMRKEFLANVSHELKTPLALIFGYAEGLNEGMAENPEDRDYYCHVIMDETVKMTHLVKQLLDLNELEFGKEQLEISRLDLTAVVKSVVAANEILIEQAGATVSFEEEETYIWADEYKLEQVITNYLSNAIHYVGGEKQIRIFYTVDENVVRLSVFNTGATIPEESMDRLWEKFYKVDKAHTREYGGTGIGLSIVKAIMNSHGKECGVINHEDGVEFWAEFDATP